MHFCWSPLFRGPTAVSRIPRKHWFPSTASGWIADSDPHDGGLSTGIRLFTMTKKVQTVDDTLVSGWKEAILRLFQIYKSASVRTKLTCRICLFPRKFSRCCLLQSHAFTQVVYVISKLWGGCGTSVPSQLLWAFGLVPARESWAWVSAYSFLFKRKIWCDFWILFMKWMGYHRKDSKAVPVHLCTMLRLYVYSIYICIYIYIHNMLRFIYNFYLNNLIWESSLISGIPFLQWTVGVVQKLKMPKVR